MFLTSCFTFLQNYKYIRQTCKKLGHKGMNMRILDTDVEEIHPEIIARVKEICMPIKHSDIKSVSAGAATFHAWVGLLYQHFILSLCTSKAVSVSFLVWIGLSVFLSVSE